MFAEALHVVARRAINAQLHQHELICSMSSTVTSASTRTRGSFCHAPKVDAQMATRRAASRLLEMGYNQSQRHSAQVQLSPEACEA